MSQTSRDRVNSRRVRTHEKNSGDAVRRLGTIIQSIFCAQSGAGIRLNFWKWSGESRYPGALPPLLENFRRAFSPDPTDCPWHGSPSMWQPKCNSRLYLEGNRMATRQSRVFFENKGDEFSWKK